MPELTYSLFDPSPCNFPSPRVQLLPSLARSFTNDGERRSGFELVGSGRDKRLYTRGRYALFEAYRMCGVGPDAGLLAPAYHCRTMLDPAISLNAVITLYPLLSNLAPDLLALEAHLISMPQRPRAMLLTHYFGFPQDAASVKAFCDRHDLALIEDCSHALFNPREQPRLGQFGRYTVASPYKLLPCEEGGMLIARQGASLNAPPPRWPGPVTEFKTLINALTRRGQKQQASVNAKDIANLPESLARIQSEHIAPGIERLTKDSQTSSLYVAEEEGMAGALASQALIRMSSLATATAKRRENYETWRSATQLLPNCKPLFLVLPDDCVPYMFPLLLEFPVQHFPALKKLGMPIWRWDDMAKSSCTTAQHYRQHLLHLPCHQTLSGLEMQWMVAAVSLVLKQATNLPVNFDLHTQPPGRP